MLLLPLGGRLPKLEEGEVKRPLDDAIAQLNRLTKCWPLVFSKTIVFNMSETLGPILDTIVKVSAIHLVRSDRFAIF